MPKFVVPHRSGVHRVAAIALYRALLSQCKALDLGAPHAEQLQNVVRNRFKQVQHLQSYRRLAVSFEAGYEAIDHLDAAVAGDAERREYLMDLLERAPAKVKNPPAKVKNPPAGERSTKKKRRLHPGSGVEENNDVNHDDSHDDSSGSTSPRISLFDRPLPLSQLSGRRHVPVLFSANRIPVLRLKKPQPPALSRYIDSRIKQRQRRHDRRHRLQGELQLAQGEDAWDQILARSSKHPSAAAETKVRREPTGTPTWSDGVRGALDDVYHLMDAEKEKNRVMAGKMQAVVDRERALWEEERRDRRAGRDTRAAGETEEDNRPPPINPGETITYRPSI